METVLPFGQEAQLAQPANLFDGTGDELGELVWREPGHVLNLDGQQVLAIERELLLSFDSVTLPPRSAIAVSVPVRQTDQVRVTDCPGARPGIVNVPIRVTLTTKGPAGAVPAFVTVNPVRVSDVTTRSGSGGAMVQTCVAAEPVLPAASVARTAKLCVPGTSGEYERGLVQAA
jgi:hypothetical protein